MLYIFFMHLKMNVPLLFYLTYQFLKPFWKNIVIDLYIVQQLFNSMLQQGTYIK